MTKSAPHIPDFIGTAAGLTNEELRDRLDRLMREKAAVDGAIAVLLGEVERRQAYRDEGATSAEVWAVERFGLSVPTARAYAHVGEQAWDLPHLVSDLCAGDVSFDKVRTVVDWATPETDRWLTDRARECSVRQLAELARSSRAPADAEAEAATAHERRFCRFRDRFRTATVQLPAEDYAATRACLEARARSIPSDGETPWDQRLADAFVEVIRSSASGRGGSAPYFVVAHVPLRALTDEASGLAGELERDGLISGETVRRIACDATVALAVDDDVGHTMYEGRARREPTDAQRREIVRRDRHCRFPGCTHATFTNAHHVVPWKPDGRTDIDNLVLLCVHHHHLVHSSAWTMTGDANDELTFVGPSGRAMTSRPSPRWTVVTAGPGSGDGR